jgi:hypothetical protein
MTTIGVELGSVFALSAEPGAANVGCVSIACRSAGKAFAWLLEALLEALLEPPLEALPDALGALEPELQAASVSAPAASSTPIAVGLVARESLAMLVFLPPR